jgi:eukaryotic-like serine/threonine-protein kinase
VIGETLQGKYRLIALLGQGGMGAVYEAKNTETGDRVAVKVISRELTSDAVRSRFDREARVAGGIDTDHIARVLDAGKDDAGTPFMVMELLEGEDLSQLLDRTGPLVPDVALRIVAQACVGLQKAHEAGVMHRDIKPANLYLAKKPGGRIVVKVVDFGIAKIQQANIEASQSTGLTRTGSMLGTPLYMSPEQARSLKTIDHRTDIWSLGIVLYRALAGRTPNQDAETFGDLIAAIVTEAPRSVQEFAPWVPSEIAAVVHTALSYEPEKRYQTPAAMLEAITRLLPKGDYSLDASMLVALDDTSRKSIAPKLEVTTGSVRKKRPSQAPAEVAAEPALVSTSPAERPPSRLPLVVGAVVVVALAAVGIYRLSAPSPAPQPPVAITATTPAPEPRGPPTASAPQITPGPETRRVKLVILPEDAQVEVDGAPAKVVGGAVEISGPLGSSRRVRVFKGKAQIESDVIVSEAGAFPPKLDLGSAAKPVSPIGGAVPKATAKPAATAQPGLRGTFE